MIDKSRKVVNFDTFSKLNVNICDTRWSPSLLDWIRVILDRMHRILDRMHRILDRITGFSRINTTK
jgi:hypothetical protein